MQKIRSLIKLIIPGFLVAATGVGAGDLITASLAGKNLGLVVLAVPLIGALFKYYLTLGIAKYQFATGETLIAGWFKYFPRLFQFIFFVYLILWSFMVCGALISGAGSSLEAILNLGEHGKVILGIAQTIIVFFIVYLGSFATFEKVMSFLVFTMFFTVIGMGVLVFDFHSPIVASQNMSWSLLADPWFIGVLGGVGGTLTILSYGYWVHDSGREGKQGLKDSKIDLSISYFLTAVFSMAMIILGAKLIGTNYSKAEIIPALGTYIESRFGSWGVLLFKLGFWAGILSSLLGVWQSVPLIFADSYCYLKGQKEINLKQSRSYTYYLIAMSTIPLISLWVKFNTIQKLYGIIGAGFIPFCALSLIIIDRKLSLEFRNSKIHTIVLYLSLIFFILVMFIR